MMAHRADGENPVTYSKLILAAQKLERQAEGRDPLLLKTTTARSLSITISHSQGNLFPSRKLKSNCTFTAQSTVVEDHETEEDSGPKPNEEKEAKYPAEGDVGMTGKVSDVNPLLGYITWFDNVVELYQKKELQLLWLW